MAARAKEIDFYRRWKERPGRRERRRRALRTAFPFALAFAVGIGAWGAPFLRNLRTQAEIDRITGWCESPRNLQAEDEALQKLALNGSLRADAAGVKRHQKAEDSYPVVDSRVLDEIGRAGGSGIALRVDSYTAGTGVLNFTALSQEVIDIPEYIRSLERTGLFFVVDYTGYGFESKSGMYAIHVTCSLDADAGREGAR